MRDRHAVVEEQLRALGPPPARRAPPPEGRLGADEQPASRLPTVLTNLGPVFVEFGLYLSSRLDLLSRRACLDLATTRRDAHVVRESEVKAIVRQQLGDGPERRFVEFDPTPCSFALWTQQHHAWLESGAPVVVTVVRPDADDMLMADLPLLPLLAPWLGTTPETLTAAVDDFSQTLRGRLDQRQRAKAFITLFEDAQAGGALDAPRCYLDHCAAGILTAERIEGIALSDTIGVDGEPPVEPGFDREAIARQLAAAWMRQVTTGKVLPYDFDLSDLRLRDDRLVLVGGVLEPLTSSGRTRLLGYLVAAAADDPDAAWEWIGESAQRGAEGQADITLRRRLRQVVPFRDGEWGGEDRLAEYMLVQWRATREAGWTMLPHELHVFRGIHAVSAATTRLARHQDTLLAALQGERLRLGLSEAQHLFDAAALPAAITEMARTLVRVPQKLDELLTLVASGRLRIKADVPDGGERREARNRTVSLVASLVTLVAVTFLVRHLTPTLGAGFEWAGAVLVLVLGGWLLAAAARL